MTQNQRMELLKLKVDKFITIDQSIRFREAQKLVQEQNTLLTKIKTEMKNLELLEVRVEKENITKILSFDVKERKSVDVHALPDEIKAEYEKTTEIWFKTIMVLQNDSLLWVAS